MRIRNGRSLASLFLASCNNGGNEDLQFLEQQLIGGSVISPSSSITPLAATCQVNRSPWDVSPIVLAFFHLDQTAPWMVLRDKEGGGGGEAITSSDAASPSIRTETESVRHSPLHFTAHSPPSDFQPIPSVPEKKKELPVLRTKNKKREKKCPSRGDSRTTRKGTGYCKRKDGKGWTCSAEAKSGSSFCHYHLSQLRSYCSKKAADGGSSGKKPQFPSWTEEDSREPHYYYYMGFGPERRKKRRNSGVPSKLSAAGHMFSTTDDEESESERGETRRRRKRVKCRSLKSLL